MSEALDAFTDRTELERSIAFTAKADSAPWRRLTSITMKRNVPIRAAASHGMDRLQARAPRRLRGHLQALVRAWWEGPVSSGDVRACQDWIRFTTLKMEAINESMRPSIFSFPLTGTSSLSLRRPWKSNVH